MASPGQSWKTAAVTTVQPSAAQSAEATREKTLVALSSVLAAVALTGTKIVVGVMSGSLGILSEAAHSGLDLVAAVVTYFAVRAASRPADREHTYGHGKVENLSALFETVLLLGTCVWIVYEAVRRLAFADVHVEVSGWAFGVMALSIVVDWSRSRALKRAADKYQSQALEADALHFSTDIWSSCVVIVGLICVWLADRLGQPWLEKADAVAGIGVAAIVVWVSIQLGRRTIDALLDAVPGDLRDKVAEAARVDDVLEVGQVRIRQSGPETFADVTIHVSRAHSVERAHEIADAAESSIRRQLPGADVVVHVEPRAQDEEDLLTTVRLTARRLGVAAHSIRLSDQGGRLTLGLHLELDEELTLGQAHEQATAFEAALREALPEIDDVVTHLEPAHTDVAASAASPEDMARLRSAIDEVRRELCPSLGVHALEAHREGDELTVSFHCTLAADTAIADAHRLSHQVEQQLRRRVPQVGRLVVHVEPASDEASSADA